MACTARGARTVAMTRSRHQDRPHHAANCDIRWRIMTHPGVGSAPQAHPWQRSPSCSARRHTLTRERGCHRAGARLRHPAHAQRWIRRLRPGRSLADAPARAKAFRRGSVYRTRVEHFWLNLLDHRVNRSVTAGGCPPRPLLEDRSTGRRSSRLAGSQRWRCDGSAHGGSASCTTRCSTSWSGPGEAVPLRGGCHKPERERGSPRPLWHGSPWDTC